MDLLTLFSIADLMTDNCWRVDSMFERFPSALLGELVLVALAFLAGSRFSRLSLSFLAFELLLQ